MKWVLALALATLPSGLYGQDPTPGCPDPGPDSRRELLGTWTQDDTGPVLVYRRRYQFAADSTYELVVTSRPLGSLAETVVGRRRGRFSIKNGCLALVPSSDAPTIVPWRIARDPYVGDIQLMLSRPDGTVDVYYRK